MDRIQNFIDGEFVPAASGRHLEIIEPATGKSYALVPDSGAVDVDRARHDVRSRVDEAREGGKKKKAGPGLKKKQKK